MRDEWSVAFGEMARAHWTPERVGELTGSKRLLVTPDAAPLLLRALGLLHRDATMPPRQVHKFLQLNHMLWTLGPPLRELMGRFAQLNIVDAGCGRSYLSLALAWCFENVWMHPVRIIGVDRNAALIAECRRITELAGLDHLMAYVASDLESFALDQGSELHALIALHACDTATDDAIALGLAQKAELIAVAPCCQAELARGWRALSEADTAGAFAPLWNSPQLRRASAATLTDTFRTLLLAAAGYDTRAVEFVASAHTPKNTLIRAMRRTDFATEPAKQYLALRDATGGVPIKLERLLASELRARLEIAKPTHG
ncbi:MAG: SAM-dependent methyltransferase [Bradymonadaceae bacterium]|nr:SAM-dependent methyltransferase [Lujinxingiaceae bacterium]